MFKKTLFTLIFMLLSYSVEAAEFINPLNFKNTIESRQKVINYIKAKTYYDYCVADNFLCNNATLRMMEEEDLKAFKNLIGTEKKYSGMLNKIIYDYCVVDNFLCTYSTIDMMLEEEIQASKKELVW